MSDVSFWKDKNIKQNIRGSLLVGVIFVVLRLTGVLMWSWVAVTTPFWAAPLYWVLAAIIRGLMKKQANETISACVGVGGIIHLFFIFAILRALSVIDWGWGVISIPLWVGTGLLVLVRFSMPAARKRASEETK